MAKNGPRISKKGPFSVPDDQGNLCTIAKETLPNGRYGNFLFVSGLRSLKEGWGAPGRSGESQGVPGIPWGSQGMPGSPRDSLFSQGQKSFLTARFVQNNERETAMQRIKTLPSKKVDGEF